MSAKPDHSAVKQAAEGKWPQVLRRLAPELSHALDAGAGRHVRCPLPDHEDHNPSFRFDKPEEGRAICSCGNYDGFALLQRLRGWDFPQVVREVATCLGLTGDDNLGKQPRQDALQVLCQQKHIPITSIRVYGARARGQVVVVPQYDGAGKQCSETKINPKGDAKERKGKNARGKPAGLHMPHDAEGLVISPRPGETWLLVESFKCAAALHSLGYLAAGMNGKQLKEGHAALFDGCDVTILHHLDKAGVDGAWKTAARLYTVPNTVRVARMPGEIKRSGGDDVRDVLRRPNGKQIVRGAIDDARLWSPQDPTCGRSRPNVDLDLDEAEVASQVIEHLGELGWIEGHDESHRIFHRSGKLVQVTKCKSVAVDGVEVPDTMLRIRPMPEAILRERITSAVALYQPSNDDEPKPMRPPKWLISAIHERGQYPPSVRPLNGIVRSPTLRPDGSVLQTTGYDHETRLLYVPDGDYPRVPEAPTLADANRAANELLATVCDFPFAGPEHESAWLSFLLTLNGRSAIAGPCPMFTFDANTRGSGKSMLCDVASLIAFGDRMPRRAWPHKDNELRKVITSIALEAIPSVLFDNVTSKLGTASLDAALTGTSWSDRLLCRNETTGTLFLTTVWVATGNNLELTSDAPRRVLPCRLDSPHEHPEDRNDFEQPDLLGWVKSHRHPLAVAAVTVLRAYIAAGRPDMQLPTWGSYEAWSSLIRNAIVWVGLPDPADTRSTVREADQSAELLRLLLDGIAEADQGEGLTAADIERLVTETSGSADSCPSLRAAISELCERPTSKQIGYALRRFAGRVCGGRRLVGKAGHRKIKRWSVITV